MPLGSRMFRVVPAFLLVVLLSVSAFADTIRLKDGSIIKGKIVSFTGGRFTVAIGEGSRKRQMTFGSAEIESIDFDSPRDNMAYNPPADRSPSVVKVAEKRPAVTTPEIIESEDVEPEPEPMKSEPVPAPIVKSQPVITTPPATTAKKSTFGKPIELSVKVLGDNTANGWTNSGWIVKKGQRIRITGNGEVSIGGGRKTGPSGLYDVEDDNKLLKSVPTGALIAVIGDDNNDFIWVGADREFVASRDGALFLGLNEGNLNDNSGSFDVKVEISPNSGGE